MLKYLRVSGKTGLRPFLDLEESANGILLILLDLIAEGENNLQ
jgi:hypothetical protein